MSDLITKMSSSDDTNKSLGSINPEDKIETIIKLYQYDLEKHRTREVLEMFTRAVVPELIKNGSYIIWDLVPITCQRLRGLSEFRFKTFNLCQQILIDLCELCSPKELLIVYLAELENDLNSTRYAKRDTQNEEENSAENNNDVEELEITDSNCFKALLKPFEIILLKLSSKRNETLKSVLCALNEHVSRLSLSSISKFDFENEDRANLTFDPVIKSVNSVLSMYVDFLETFVREVDLYNPENQQNQILSKTFDPNVQRTILLKTLLLILDYPLKYMDLSAKEFNSQDKKTSNPNLSNLINEDFVTTRLIAIKIVRLIYGLHSNFYTLLNRTDLITSDQDIESHSDLSSTNFQSAMCILCYLLATEPELSPSNFMPRVYTHVYNFGIHLPYVRSLLEDRQFLVHDKGLELLSSLLDRIKEESLEASFLDLLRQHPIEKSLTSVMTYSSVKSARSLALEVFKKLVKSFDALGRCKILYSIIAQPNEHPGLQGQVIIMYKDFIVESSSSSNQIYFGSNLHRFVRSVISVSLPQNENSDLLEKNDLIFTAINFFKYLFMADRKSVNKTCIWDILPVIQENFLKVLQKALEQSRTQFKLELCKLKEMKVEIDAESKSLNKARKNRPKIDIRVLENSIISSLPELTVEEEHQRILFALQNFDIIENLLNHLTEIIDEKQKQ